MGLFDDFDIDMDDVKAAGGFDFEDGFYEWTISEALRQNGSKNKPDNTFFIIKYNLDEAGTYWEWFTLAVDGDSDHKDAKRSLGYLKERLLSLGIPAAELNSFEPEDLEGIEGTFKLVTTKNDKGTYQNIRNFKASVSEEDEEEEAPAPKKAPARRKPAAKSAPEPDEDEDGDEESVESIKARVAAKRAAREAEAAPVRKKAPARRKPADDDEDENPFE